MTIDSAMKVLHLASNLTGGAGIATQRIHLALLSAEIDSRILTLPPTTGDPAQIAQAPGQSRSIPLRLAQRVGLFRSSAEVLRRRFHHARNTDGTALSVELFSPPYSDFVPENHKWFKEADVIHLHWTSGLVDWSRITKRLNVPVVLNLHDQEPYLGCVHYRGDLAANDGLQEIETECQSVKKRFVAFASIGRRGK